MANFLYNTGREGFLTSVTVGSFTGQIDWKSDDIYAALVTSSYTPSSSHTNMSNIPSAAVLKTTALSGLATDTAGSAQASNTTFSSVSAGNTGTYVVIYRVNNTGSPVDADNVLIACIDTASNLPVTTNGGDITVVWDGGSGNIFKL